MTTLRQAAEQALEALEDANELIFVASAENDEEANRVMQVAKTAITALIEALAEPEQELDPALHFCHRFAILLECMVHADASNTFWEEAHTLLDEYYKAQAWWRQKMGEPYVSGFGKD